MIHVYDEIAPTTKTDTTGFGVAFDFFLLIDRRTLLRDPLLGCCCSVVASIIILSIIYLLLDPLPLNPLVMNSC